ncbi:hypothetical protein F7725_004082 [Dissostichus mawsoni]|uniref:Uncharacterized protein n=1 Tax=Dissostichus mawsoni TaxID=36200 RepID=A0A7J5YC23_DISMA|nr:hypothetical protein F7725_004082 [Dissostichus mawsoni]
MAAMCRKEDGEDRIRTTITNPHHKEPDQNQQRCQTVRPPPPSRPRPQRLCRHQGRPGQMNALR